MGAGEGEAGVPVVVALGGGDRLRQVAAALEEARAPALPAAWAAAWAAAGRE